MDRQMPKFTYEANFLDWYERWTDEVISGDLQTKSASWFGYTMGGNEDDILKTYFATPDNETKANCLAGIRNKQTIKQSTLDTLENEYTANTGEIKRYLLQTLVKFDYSRAKPYLLEYIQSDLLSVFQFIFWYAEDKSLEWLSIIEENIPGINDEETFRVCTYLLDKTKTDYARLIIPFTKNEDKRIRVTAFYSLGKLENKSEYIDIFINGLCDPENRVIHTALQALSGIKDNRLLKYYRQLAECFPEEQDYILVNLNHRLKDFKLDNLSVQKIDVEEFLKKQNKFSFKKLFRFGS
jgi:hypothetical protein